MTESDRKVIQIALEEAFTRKHTKAVDKLLIRALAKVTE